MRIDAAFPSKYVKAADLKGQIVTVTIARCEEEVIEDKRKPVIYFLGTDKGMVLNKTNSYTIAAAYGNETDDWYGKKIQLLSMMVDFQGKQVEGLRVRIPAAPRAPVDRQSMAAPLAQTQPVAAVRPPAQQAFAPVDAVYGDDEIPF